MGEVKGFANVVFPARDLEAGVAAWTAMLGREPAFVGDDFAVFTGDGVEVGLTALPGSTTRSFSGRSTRSKRPSARSSPGGDCAG